MSWTYPETYDVLVVGGGHAGCEAALAPARMGLRVLLLTMSVEGIAKMSCNPAIGGVGKGHMVREIDALGGMMGKVADRTGIQFRMLNASKGPAVFAPRCQSDKLAYADEMRGVLEAQEGVEIQQGMVESLCVEGGTVCGVVTREGVRYRATCVVICSGTFLRGLMHIGEGSFQGGRLGDAPSVGLSKNLVELGFRLGRLKTGTPPRVHARSIDYSLCEEQPGMEGVRFSFDAQERQLPQLSCYITYTNAKTHEIIRDNVHRSAMYSGQIRGTGVRYCPSIEDKIVKFPDRDRHQIFCEPEGHRSCEVYLNGLSSSLPLDVQYAYVRSIQAFRDVEIIRPGYAIEYDYAVSGQITNYLETRLVKNLFFAGQINGTTGYEEAAAQGLMAGINAALRVQGKAPFTLTRTESYIGVMIDDLNTKVLQEPYRMFTSRAERRLLLRQDNADLRLRAYGYALGLIDQEQMDRLERKREVMDTQIAWLKKEFVQENGKGYSLAQILSRPQTSYSHLREWNPQVCSLGKEIEEQITYAIKYAGYIAREELEAKRLEVYERLEIPANFLYHELEGLRREAADQLASFTPSTIGQASRISGVNPADISLLLVALKKRHETSSHP